MRKSARQFGLRVLNTRAGIAAVGAVVVLAMAGGAYAYFTTTGSGTGSATVGANSTVTIAGTSASALYPGTSSTVSFTVTRYLSASLLVRIPPAGFIPTWPMVDECVAVEQIVNGEIATGD